MDPQRRKATRTASKAKAASPEVSARSQGTRTKPAPRKPTPTDPSERPVAPEAAGPKKQNCGPTRAPGPPRRKSAANLQAARAREARIEKARSFLNAEDALDGPAGLAEEPAPPGAPEPPLPGSSGRPTAGLGQDPWVPAPSPGHGVSAPGSWKPVAVLRKLKLKSEEISEAANVVNTVVDHLLQRMQSLQSEFKGVQLLRTGSYYERVKVANPNEFDVMFKLDVPRIDLEEYRNSGAHYLVRFKRNPKGNPLSEFIEEGMLSASKMLSKFRKIIKEEIKKIEAIDVIVEKKKRGCPAVTLLIRKPKEISVDLILALTVRSSWPASTLEGLPIRNWLGSKVRTDLRRQPFYLVPKHAKEGRGFQGETWRLSFSHVEKYILKNHGTSKTCCEKGRVKCCRKDCLKLMKYLLEQLKKKFQDRKEVDDFCSYHMKTAFFHICSQDPEDSQWQARDVKFCFDRCVAYFLQCLETECLTNFFIPGVNQFSRDKIDKISKEFLLKQIEYERNNGYPVFSEF